MELSHNWRYELIINNYVHDITIRGRYDFWGEKAQFFEIVGTKGKKQSSQKYDIILNDEVVFSSSSKEEILFKFKSLWKDIPKAAFCYFEPYESYYVNSILSAKI